MNTNKDNDGNVSFTDSHTESQINSDLSETESRITEGIISQSTPTPVKKDDSNDMRSMMQLLLNKFDINKNDLCYKYVRCFSEY